VDREFILEEVRRTASENGGVALGTARFEKETGIRRGDWEGKYWARWGDALLEAGHEPNALNQAFSTEAILGTLAAIARKLGHIPTRAELKLARRTDSSIPSHTVFDRHLGPTKPALIAKLAAFCDERPEFEDVAAICTVEYAGPTENKRDTARPVAIGEVYLIKSGRYYKIGYSVSAERRTREFQIQLPEMPQRIHTISTDDPRGIEVYWHKRFEAKRVRPDAEFFRLDDADVAAFRAWKRIV